MRRAGDRRGEKGRGEGRREREGWREMSVRKMWEEEDIILLRISLAQEGEVGKVFRSVNVSSADQRLEKKRRRARREGEKIKK